MLLQGSLIWLWSLSSRMIPDSMLPSNSGLAAAISPTLRRWAPKSVEITNWPGSIRMSITGVPGCPDRKTKGAQRSQPTQNGRPQVLGPHLLGGVGDQKGNGKKQGKEHEPAHIQRQATAQIVTIDFFIRAFSSAKEGKPCHPCQKGDSSLCRRQGKTKEAGAPEFLGSKP